MEPTTSRAKQEQLARVRRNQQRCRERKRAHVASLEEQIQDLQERLRQCTPCAPTPASTSNTSEQIRGENDARRELLLALGIDIDMQQQYIESVAKRQAVRAVLSEFERQDQAVSTSPFTTKTGDCDFGVAIRDKNGSSLGAAANVPSCNGEERLDTHASTLQAPETSSTDLAKVARLGVSWKEQHAATPPTMPQMDDWLLSANWAQTWPINQDETDDLTWLVNFSPRAEHYAMAASTTAKPTSLLSNTESQLREEERPRTPEKVLDLLSSREPSIDRCFLETAIRFRPGNVATSCSVAISMVMQHNRKGLSLAELYERMKPGFITATHPSGECQIDSGMLLNVLAEVTSG